MSFKHFEGYLLQSLSQRRKDLGLSQPQLDQKVGVAEGVVAKWEGAFRSPTLFNAYCWANSLGCDLVLVPRVEEANARRRNRPRP